MHWVNDQWTVHFLPWASVETYDTVLGVFKTGHCKVVNAEISQGKMRATLLIHVDSIPDIIIALRIIQ